MYLPIYDNLVSSYSNHCNVRTMQFSIKVKYVSISCGFKNLYVVSRIFLSTKGNVPGSMPPPLFCKSQTVRKTS